MYLVLRFCSESLQLHQKTLQFFGVSEANINPMCFLVASSRGQRYAKKEKLDKREWYPLIASKLMLISKRIN